MNPIKDTMKKQWVCAKCNKTHKKKMNAEACCHNIIEEIVKNLRIKP